MAGGSQARSLRCSCRGTRQPRAKSREKKSSSTGPGHQTDAIGQMQLGLRLACGRSLTAGMLAEAPRRVDVSHCAENQTMGATGSCESQGV